MLLNLKDHIRAVPDFPKEGILFYDIGTLLAHAGAWSQTLSEMEELIRPDAPKFLLAVESRGFLLAAPLAERLGIGLVMVRKKGKLPGATRAHSYALEYGQDTIEIQEGLLSAGDRVVVVDDLLATGGTASAAIHLAREMGAEVVSAAFVVELDFLSGRSRLDVPVRRLLSYNE